MREIRKKINKENLKFYVEKILKNEEFKEDILNNIRCLHTRIKLSDDNSEECILEINTNMNFKSHELFKNEIRRIFDEFISTTEKAKDYIENCKYLYMRIDGKNEDITVQYDVE